MSTSDLQNKIIQRVETELNVKVLEVQHPKQGMSGKVILIETEDRDYAVKYGVGALRDLVALELISKSDIDIPIPKVYFSFEIDGIGVLIMERIKYPLLESTSPSDMPLYIPSMLQTLKKLHTIRSESPGVLNTTGSVSWSDVLLSRITGKDFDWEEISKREGLDRELVLRAIERLADEIKSTQFNTPHYSLLHTDFNQRNLFIDPERKIIAGIVDWEEAMFGDPIYDYARVRMLLWHFDFSSEAIDLYYKLVDLSDEEKELERLYWTYLVIQYLAWYSEELNDFNLGRIELHQEYLRKYSWDS